MRLEGSGEERARIFVQQLQEFDETMGLGAEIANTVGPGDTCRMEQNPTGAGKIHENHKQLLHGAQGQFTTRKQKRAIAN